MKWKYRNFLGIAITPWARMTTGLDPVYTDTRIQWTCGPLWFSAIGAWRNDQIVIFIFLRVAWPTDLYWFRALKNKKLFLSGYLFRYCFNWNICFIISMTVWYLWDCNRFLKSNCLLNITFFIICLPLVNISFFQS